MLQVVSIKPRVRVLPEVGHEYVKTVNKQELNNCYVSICNLCNFFAFLSLTFS